MRIKDLNKVSGGVTSFSDSYTGYTDDGKRVDTNINGTIEQENEHNVVQKNSTTVKKGGNLSQLFNSMNK